MAQKRLLLCCLPFVLLFSSAQLSGQTKNPYKNLVTSVNAAVFDTISGLQLDVNESTPQARHGNVDLNIISAGGSGSPYVFQVKYTPDPGFVGVDTFVLEQRYASTYPYLIYRGFRVSVKASKITARNDYAVSNSGAQVTVDVLSNDISNGGALTLTSLPVINHGSGYISGNKVVFTPESGFTGIAHLNYVVCDATGTCQTAALSIGVNNGLPFTQALQVCTNKNTALEIPLNYSGYSVAQAPANGTLVMINGRAFRYTPNSNFTGTDQFSLKTVVNGTPYTRNIEIKVLNTPSQNQMAVDDVVFTPKGRPITFNVKDNDIGPLQVRSWVVPNNFPGTLSNTNSAGAVTFTPSPGFSGVATFTYKIGNSSAPALETGTVSIVVDNMAPPTKYSPYLNAPSGVPLVLHYDLPFSGFSFSIIQQPENGTLEYYPGVTTHIIQGQSVTGYNLLVYTPENDYVGKDQIGLLYCAPNGECQTTKIRVNVTDAPDAPAPYCVAACTWPGDLNQDGWVNHKDLLPFGYTEGISGSNRPDGSIDWYGQFGANWNNPYVKTGSDLRHVDTNGDGTINHDDQQAIHENYNRMYNLALPNTPVEKGLPIQLNLLTPAPKIGDPVRIEVSLGTEQMPALDVYGFTFDVKIGGGLVDSAFAMNFYKNSWINLNAPFLTLSERPFAGKFETAFTRTNGVPASGFGPIGEMDFVIIDIVDVGGQDGRPELIINPVVTNSDGREVPGTPIVLDLSVIAEQRSNAAVSSEISVYPIPASNALYVNWGKEMEVHQLQLRDLNGKTVLEQMSREAGQASIQVTDLPAGLYFLCLQTPSGVLTKKVQVIK